MRILKTSIIVLIILRVASVIIPVIILKQAFGFPEILRQPADIILQKFQSDELTIKIGYYIYLVSSLLTIPLSILIVQLYKATRETAALNAFLITAVLATIFQCIGLVRWFTVVPFLANSYTSSHSQEVLTIFESNHRFAGMGIGEHLGYLAIGTWTVILAFIIKSSDVKDKILCWLGIIIGVALIVSSFEPIGLGSQSLNFKANTAWSIWLILFAVNLTFNKKFNEIN
jgi:hypothetical protein